MSTGERYVAGALIWERHATTMPCSRDYIPSLDGNGPGLEKTFQHPKGRMNSCTSLYHDLCPHVECEIAELQEGSVTAIRSARTKMLHCPASVYMLL